MHPPPDPKRLVVLIVAVVALVTGGALVGAAVDEPPAAGPGGGSAAPTSPASDDGSGTTVQPVPSPAPSTASSTTAPTSPPGAGRGDGPVGYIGCSQGEGAVDGYAALGGRRLWDKARDYGGGSVVRWGRGDPVRNPYWESFDRALRAQPTTVFWWQPCTRAGDSDAANYEAALAVLDELRRRVPDATVYVSAQNDYDPPGACGQSGVDGPERMERLAARLAAEGHALAGPDVGDLSPAESRDGCHPNEEGQRVLGAPLLEFFG